MLQRLSARSQRDDAGFTLIELLVVIIIIGILAAIAIPVFLNQRKKGWDAQAKSDSRNLANSEEAYIIEHGAYLDFDSLAPPVGVEEFSGYRDSDKVVTRAAMNGAFGYCILSKSRGGDYFVYDSQAGGLNPKPNPVVPATWPVGSACGVSAPAMP